MKKTIWYWIRFPIYIIGDLLGFQTHWDKDKILEIAELQNLRILKLEERVDVLEQADALLRTKRRN